MKGTERKLLELLLTGSVIVSKRIEDKFEEKLKETFPKNFRSIRNQIKQQSKEVVTTLEHRGRKNCLTLRIKIDLNSKEHRYRKVGNTAVQTDLKTSPANLTEEEN